MRGLVYEGFNIRGLVYLCRLPNARPFSRPCPFHPITREIMPGYEGNSAGVRGK